LIESRIGAKLESVPTTSDFECVARGAALGVTHPRVAVMSAVQDHPHADTDWIIDVIREDLGEVPHQVGYDVLRGLTAAARRFQPTGSVARYAARGGDSRHHVVCGACGAIAGVDRAGGYTACPTPPANRATRSRKPGVITAPMARVCRGNSCRVRWLVAVTQRSTQRSNTAPESEEPSPGAASHQE
jgi:Fur family ferric uptake transcriptional regulator